MKAYGPWMEEGDSWRRLPLWEQSEDDIHMERAYIMIYMHENESKWGTYAFKDTTFNFHWFNSIEEAKKAADHLLTHRGFKLVNSNVYSLM
jgi:hypothetical protein